MDPNACLQLIDDFLSYGEIEEASRACTDLAIWISKGGFAPDWENYPKAANFFRHP